MTEAGGAGGAAPPDTFSLLAASGSFGTALRLLTEGLCALAHRLDTPSAPADLPRLVAREAAALLAAGRCLRSQADARSLTVTGQDAALFARVGASAFDTAKAVKCASGRWTEVAERGRLELAVNALQDLQSALDVPRATTTPEWPTLALATTSRGGQVVGLILAWRLGFPIPDQATLDEKARAQVELAEALARCLVRHDPEARDRLDKAQLQLGITSTDWPQGVEGPSIGVAHFVVCLSVATGVSIVSGLALTGEIVGPGGGLQSGLPVDPDPEWLLANVRVGMVGQVSEKARALIECACWAQDLGVPGGCEQDAKDGRDAGHAWLTSQLQDTWPVNRPEVHPLKTLRQVVELAFGPGLETLLARLARPRGPTGLDVEQYLARIAEDLQDLAQTYTDVLRLHDARHRLRAATGRGEDDSLTVAKVFDEHPVVVIAGEPGAGKTTAIKRHTHRLATLAQRDPTAPIPIFVELKRLSHGCTGYTDILERAAAEVTLYHTRAVTPDQLLLLMSSRRCVFFLDGLNEVGRDIRQQCVDAVTDFVKKFPGHQFVITTRAYGYRLDAFQFPTFAANDLRLQDIDHLYRSGRKADDSHPFMAWIGASESLARLARNPATLAMMISVFPEREDPGTLPEGRARLIERIVDARIEDPKLLAELRAPGVDSEVKALVCIPLARRMQTDGQCLRLAPALELIRQELACRGHTAVLAEHVLQDLGRARVLDAIDDQVSFRHQIIQEYFAARGLRSTWRESRRGEPGARRATDELVRCRRDQVWHESFALMAGLLDPEELRSLVEWLERRDPVLAAMCLANAPVLMATDEAAFVGRAGRRLRSWRYVSGQPVKWLGGLLFLLAAVTYTVLKVRGDVELWWHGGDGDDPLNLELYWAHELLLAVSFPAWVPPIHDWYFAELAELRPGLDWVVELGLPLLVLGFLNASLALFTRRVLHARILPLLAALLPLRTDRSRVELQRLNEEARWSPWNAWLLPGSFRAAFAHAMRAATWGAWKSAIDAQTSLEAALEELEAASDPDLAMSAIKELVARAQQDATARETVAPALLRWSRDAARPFSVRMSAFRGLEHLGVRARRPGRELAAWVRRIAFTALVLVTIVTLGFLDLRSLRREFVEDFERLDLRQGARGWQISSVGYLGVPAEPP